MAQERNALNNSAETAAIKSEIERTRVEMSETIGEIQERLSPDHLLQQAKDGVKDAAAGKARSIMNSASERAATAAYRAKGIGSDLASYAQAHPFRIAITVGALAWWIMRSRNRADDYYGTADTSWEDDDAMSFGAPTLRSRVASARDTVGEYASSARETVGEYASSAREAVGQYASTAGQYASTAREAAGEYAEAARERARCAAEAARRTASNATSTVDDFVHENPVAVGVIALAVGAAIGMAIPSTEIENRAMGETRDRAWERASKAASEIKENVTKKVENVAETFVNENVISVLTGSSSEPMGRA